MPTTSSGLLVLDKPTGWTSHDVVAVARKKLGTKKVGHAGTLDPLATGVLLLAVGSATRLLEFIVGADKTYEARLRLGATSDTYDADGEITENAAAEPATRAAIERALAKFHGEIMQVPPIYSALKIGGRPAHRLARAGEAVVLPPRPVSIHTLEILAYAWPELRLKVDCGSGTYVRSLAHDLGQLLGCGAYLTQLRRMRVGQFTLAAAADFESFSVADLRPVEPVVAGLPRAQLTAAEVVRLGHGLPVAHAAAGEAVACFAGERLVAIAAGDGAKLQPRKVLA